MKRCILNNFKSDEKYLTSQLNSAFSILKAIKETSVGKYKVKEKNIKLPHSLFKYDEP